MNCTIYSWIQSHARMRPGATALVRAQQPISYARFSADIERVTRRLSGSGLPVGSRVAVSISNGYMHWLVLVALSRMGLPSVSLDPREVSQLPGAIHVTDVAGIAHGSPFVVVPQEWLGAESDRLPAFRDEPIAADSICRIVLSSGTTGRPKLVAITYDQLVRRCHAALATYNLHGAARFASLVGRSTVAGFVLPVAAWAAGAALLLRRRADPHGQGLGLLADRPTSIFASPATLGEIVAALPESHGGASGLAVFVAGGALPAALSDATRLRLSPDLSIIYGSTEVSTATMCHAAAAAGRRGFVGWPMGYAAVEVVDAQGRLAPAGEPGRVRLRGEGMAQGYLDDDVATADCFRDGWFYPGDVGILSPDGGLSIVGRTSELLNIGGAKIAPDAIDEALAGCPGVMDLAAFAAVANGSEHLFVAVAATQAFRDEDLRERFRRAFPTYPLPAIVRMDGIPRNAMGKAMRARMRASAEKELHGKIADGARIGKTTKAGVDPHDL